MHRQEKQQKAKRQLFSGQKIIKSLFSGQKIIKSFFSRFSLITVFLCFTQSATEKKKSANDRAPFARVVCRSSLASFGLASFGERAFTRFMTSSVGLGSCKTKRNLRFLSKFNQHRLVTSSKFPGCS